MSAVQSIVIPNSLRLNPSFFSRRTAMNLSRRQFLLGAGATALAAQFDPDPISPSSAADYEFKIGYQVMTWGDKIEQAIDDISGLGFRGVEIRRADYEKYAGREISSIACSILSPHVMT